MSHILDTMVHWNGMPWNVITTIIGRIIVFVNTNKQIDVIIDSKLTIDSETKSNNFNDYYINVGRELLQNIDS